MTTLMTDSARLKPRAPKAFTATATAANATVRSQAGTALTHRLAKTDIATASLATVRTLPT